MEFSKPTAAVIADSITPLGHRLTTIHAKIHRFVLAELNTHRMFSRNSASSRAIPAKKLRDMVGNDPAMPLYWGKNQKGMQAAEELSYEERSTAEVLWLNARLDAIRSHEMLEDHGLHKQVLNRLLEPFLWHHVIISATEWDNFFNQRCHKDAQPEMRAAAEAIYEAYNASEPIVRSTHLTGGQHEAWHLPYVTDDERHILTLDQMRAVSVARCARVSYLNHEGVMSLTSDLDLYVRLVKQSPGHWSPLEHVAQVFNHLKSSKLWSGNFQGWTQLRKMVEPGVPKYCGIIKGDRDVPVS